MLEYQGFKISQDEQWNTMYRVSPAGKGGSIPTVLSGLYQTTVAAKDSIDTYKAQYKKKG